MTSGEYVVLYGFHMTGALLAIFTYLITEWQDLNAPSVSFAQHEKTVRWAIYWCVVFFLVGFITGEALGALPLGICCFDAYLPVNHTAIDKAYQNQAYIQEANNKRLMELSSVYNTSSSDAPLYQGLYDTAHGWGLFIRLMGFWCEFWMFEFMIMANLVVWYFNPERSLTQNLVKPSFVQVNDRKYP